VDSHISPGVGCRMYVDDPSLPLPPADVLASMHIVLLGQRRLGTVRLLLCCAVLCYGVVCCAMLWCGVLWCGVVCYAMLCYDVLCYGVVWYAMLCYAMLCYAMLWCAMLCYVMLYYAMLCYAMLCYAMLCYAVVCYAMLCYAVLCYGVVWCGVLMLCLWIYGYRYMDIIYMFLCMCRLINLGYYISSIKSIILSAYILNVFYNAISATNTISTTYANVTFVTHAIYIGVEGNLSHHLPRGFDGPQGLGLGQWQQ
jgi:hypothetical protein